MKIVVIMCIESWIAFDNFIYLDPMNTKSIFSLVSLFKRKVINIPVVKMYVLVRLDMATVDRAVQAGHAVAEYMKNHYITTTWRNGHMIYLGIPSEDSLNKWEARLQAAGIRFSTFVEPDWGEPQKTALAFCGTGEIVRELPLLRLDDAATCDIKMGIEKHPEKAVR